jgi:hypothetical protein
VSKRRLLIGLGLVVGIGLFGYWATLRPPRIHEATFNGKPTSHWRKAMKESKEFYNRNSGWEGDMTYVPVLPNDVAALPVLLELLGGADRDVRNWTVEILNLWREYPPELDEAIPLLIRMLDEERTLWAASEVLRRFGRRAVPALVEAMASDNKVARQGATRSLWHMGSGASPAVPALVGALKDDDDLTRLLAVEALGYIGPEAQPAVGPLIAVLKDKYDTARAMAAETLGKIGSHELDVVPALLKVLDDNSDFARMKAVLAIGKLHHDPAICVPAITKAMTQGKLRPLHAAKALGDFGPDARQAVPLLIEHLDGPPPDRDFTDYAIYRALEKILDNNARATVLERLNTLRHETFLLRISVPVAVGSSSFDFRPGIPAILAVLRSVQTIDTIRQSGFTRTN